jgi:hypothetical protein
MKLVNILTLVVCAILGYGVEFLLLASWAYTNLLLRPTDGLAALIPLLYSQSILMSGFFITIFTLMFFGIIKRGLIYFGKAINQ